MSLTSLSTLATLELTGPRRITDLAASEGVTQLLMTALVTALERSGLVERRSDPSDRRVALVTLTPDGLSYIRGLRPRSWRRGLCRAHQANCPSMKPMR